MMKLGQVGALLGGLFLASVSHSKEENHTLQMEISQTRDDIIRLYMNDEKEYEWLMEYVRRSNCVELNQGNLLNDTDWPEAVGFLDIDCSEGVPMCFEDKSQELIC